MGINPWPIHQSRSDRRRFRASHPPAGFQDHKRRFSMNYYNLLAFLILLLISLGLTVGIWAAIARNLRGLLDQAMKLPDGTTFYLRTFLIGLLLAAAAGALGTEFSFKPTDPFMEYVWRIGSGLQNVCQYLFIFVLVYILLITVLVAVLRKKHEQ